MDFRRAIAFITQQDDDQASPPPPMPGVLATPPASATAAATATATTASTSHSYSSSSSAVPTAQWFNKHNLLSISKTKQTKKEVTPAQNRTNNHKGQSRITTGSRVSKTCGEELEKRGKSGRKLYPCVFGTVLGPVK